MTKEEMHQMAEKYRKIHYKWSIGIAIFIFILSIVLLMASIFMIVSYYQKPSLLIVGCIMGVVGFFDIFLGIRFIGYAKKKTALIGDKEAVEHYTKIYGIPKEK